MLCALLIEIPVATIWLVILSIFGGEIVIKQSWLTGFPNSMSNIGIIVKNVFQWAINVADNRSYTPLHKKCDRCTTVMLTLNGIAFIIISVVILGALSLWVAAISIALSIGLFSIANAMANGASQEDNDPDSIILTRFLSWLLTSFIVTLSLGGYFGKAHIRWFGIGGKESGLLFGLLISIAFGAYTLVMVARNKSNESTSK
jgi:hypothetical protein